MGSVYSRKDTAIKWIKYRGVDGKVHRESTGTTNAKKALRALKLKEGDVERGVPVTPKVGRVTFNDAADRIIKDYEKNGKRSLSDLKIRIEKHLRPFFGGWRLASITTTEIEKYQDHRLGQTPKPGNATVNREVATLKRMFTLAARAGEILFVPHFPMLKEPPARKGYFEQAQFEGVLSHLPERLRPIAIFGYCTGWRRGEVLGLEWRHIDRSARVVRLDPGETKNDEARILGYGVDDPLGEIIEAAWKTHEQLAAKGVISPYVFPQLRGGKFLGKRITSFRKAWDAARKAAGCPGRLFHDFRRTMARNLTRTGEIDPTVAMRVTGHKTRSVFDRYNIGSEADVRRALGTVLGTVGRFERPSTDRKSQNTQQKRLRARSSAG
jgi:integrase